MILTLFQQLANGLALGSVYALVAVGFTMVYGILFFINLPHGDVLMVGTYVALVLLSAGIPFLPTVAAAAIFTALLGVFIELSVYRRLRFARRLAPLLSAMGVSYVLSNGIMVLQGPQTRPFPAPLSGDISIVGVNVPIVILVTVATTVILAVVLQLFIKRAALGIAIRAASQDLPTTALMGVNVNLVISVTFAISGALALIGGVMLAWRYGSVSPTIGFAVMLKAFAACVLGGIGNIQGAMLGGFILGVAEVIGAAYISSAYTDAIAFLVLIATLLFKPSGLLGGRTEVAA
ncbi:MAG TPA: branched-chain amino acid ABC transporter permease [Methylomirabilota bacterium]|nr:branched-chain amino acid ABC transporter permease [Methylomirabilota bacterium]